MPPKKSSQRAKPKKKPRALEKDDLISKSSNASFSGNIEALRRALGEAMEQQAATSEILRVIASSPSDLQPVLDAIAESAARVCSAEDTTIRLVDGNVLRMEAHHGTIERGEYERPISRHSVTGRAVTERRLIHIEDLLSVAHDEFPESVATARRTGVRTVLALPLLREGAPIGVIFIRRTEISPFSEKQLDLLKTFAD